MKLTDAKALFFLLRSKNRIDVAEDHVIRDHAERGYSVEEVFLLVKSKSGKFEDTTDPNFRGERFYWRTKDLSGKSLRMVIEFDKDEDGHLIIVISAGERK
ncbi:MAG: hypothetical protein NTX25_03555 [Proteobacteria bacterium]|nr:hypothetical protein [Pseudomonadota bacterium]